MKKSISLIVALLLAFSILAGCSNSVSEDTQEPSDTASSNATSESTASEPPVRYSACLMLNGFRGDHGLMDSATEGFEKAVKEFPCFDTKIVEAGYDTSTYETTFIDLCEQNFDILITGLWSMKGYVQTYASEYPNTKFILFDSSPEYTEYEMSNVHSISYMQNEGAFLAGALAALVSESDMPLATNSKTISVVGGNNSNTINDFMVGYIAGARYVVPEMKVLSTYIASVSDSPKCKDASLQMYSMGSDVNFSPSGGAVAGSMDAAKEAQKYVIGVDGDQAMQYLESDPEMAKLIVSSALKNAGQSIYIILKQVYENGIDSVAWGEHEIMGLYQGTVGLAKNEIYLDVVPKEIQDKIIEIEEGIISGKIEVPSAFDMTQDGVAKYFADAAK